MAVVKSVQGAWFVRHRAEAEAAGISWVLGVEQATTSRCICKFLTTTPGRVRAGATVASSSQTMRLGDRREVVH